MAFVNNFSTSFRWWDFMLGTDDRYRAYKKRLAEMRTKNMSAADYAEAEKRLNEEAEKEGLVAESIVENGGKLKTQ
jgi:methylsterol monooxygenase